MEAAQDRRRALLAVASGRSTVGELRDAGADVVLPDLSDTDEVVQAVERLTGSGRASVTGHG